MGAARADELPKLILLREGVAGADAPVGLSRELADALAARGLAVRDAPAPAVVEEPDESAALEGAARAYTALRPAEARQTLEALFARADARGASGLDGANLARALLLLALAAQATGDDAAADAALDRLLVTDPGATADPAAYPPPLRDRLERRRTSIAAQPLVVLVVATVPGALVEIDGRALAEGATQLRVPPGPHLVRARAPGHVAAGQRVDVSSDPTTIAFPLVPDPGAVLAASGPPHDEPREELLAVARTLDATLLLVDVSRGPSGLVVDVRDLASARRAHMVVPANITARALALRIAGALVPPPTTARPALPLPEGPGIWPWLVAAGVVLVGIVVVGVALAVRGDRGDFVLVWEPR